MLHRGGAATSRENHDRWRMELPTPHARSGAGEGRGTGSAKSCRSFNLRLSGLHTVKVWDGDAIGNQPTGEGD